MQISGLNASNTFSATDVLAIEINVNGVEKTYKLTGATLAAALASIGSYLTTADVVNNLTSTATNVPLAAAQGKALKDLIAQSTATQVCPISAAQQISTGNFSISFTVSKSGYMPIGVIGYNLGDRALGGKVNITGLEIANSSTIVMYGNVSTGVTLPVNCSISVLYSKA